ncbi:MAG: helicase [Planctomycetota bacterium]
MDKQQLLKALQEQRVELNDAAVEIFMDNRFEILRQSVIIEIKRLSLADLGFAEGATYGQIMESARKIGLVECPLELGPHLRLQFLGQPEGAFGFPATQNTAPLGSITVATSPLDDTDETPKGFYLRRIEGILWLRGYRSWPCHIWSPENVFVFARNSGVA